MKRLAQALGVLLEWPARRWAVTVGAAIAFAFAIAIPTALIPNPIFGRKIPPTWWSWPALIVSSVLGGLLVATYVRDSAATSVATQPDGSTDAPRDGDDAHPEAGLADGGDVDDEDRANRRKGTAGGLLTFFAVGCPVCNKLVLIALGSAGALTWFEPIQPILQAVAIALLAWAVLARLEGERFCPLPSRVGSGRPFPDAR
jgi:hypothetical protein